MSCPIPVSFLGAAAILSVNLAASVRAATCEVVVEPATEEPRPLRRAHAHNDYEHDRPLLDALAHGFTSVEADVHLVDGELLVAHDREDAKEDRTLERLYLEPLRERVREHGGRVYGDAGSVTLLIDFKAKGRATYERLREALVPYRDMLTRFEGGEVHEGAVTIVISGDRPWDSIAARDPRWVGVDGRVEDLDGDRAADLMPLVSDAWYRHFRWRGEGDMPPEERAKLRSIVRRSHERGARVRFWATPEDERVWRELRDAGVDHINTDRLEELRAFLVEEDEPESAPLDGSP